MSRYSHDNAYEIEIARASVPEVVKLLRKQGQTELATEMDESVNRYGNRTVEISVEDWTDDQLTAVLPVLKDDRKASAFIKQLLRIRQNPHGVVTNIKLLPKAMQQYLVEDVIDGWVYRAVAEGVHVAFVVLDVYWYQTSDSYGRKHDYCTIKLRANKMEFKGEDKEDDGRYDTSVIWETHDIGSGKTAADLLLQEGYLKETEDLKSAYLKDLAIFTKYQQQFGKQFLCSTYAIDVSSSSWWGNKHDRYPLTHPTKMVNDEEILHRKARLECSHEAWLDRGTKLKGKEFSQVPIHPFILMFDLTKHVNCWCHAANMKQYKYDPLLRDKLVLPDKHRDLIDVLTSDMDVFVEDIIEGKSGGTAVLCYGAPGLGKTLTAEVYSEVVKRPLYRVHAGQLGTDVQSVENALEEILRRAERWGAVLLLDEADVYIRQRSNDIHHNAVVAAFLRTLEYFHGLLFMTTNRVADVDDAIASRMVAMFRYDIPDEAQATALWNILSKQFGIALTEKMIITLVREFPKSSGRDIKQLLKLVMKYCNQKKLKMDIQAFKICAMFRGII